MEYPDPAGQYKTLVRHFLERFFDFDAVTSSQIDSIEKNALTIQTLALLVLPGALKCMFLFPKYGYYIYRPDIERDLATLTDKCFLLSLSMILIGLIVIFEWEMLFPDRKDYLILTHLPVATRTIFSAKFVALAAFLLVFTLAIDLCPTFLFPSAVLANNRIGHLLMHRTIPVSLGIRYIVSHGITMLLGNLFIFLSAISLQGILLVLVPSKLAPAVSRVVRFLCLLMLLCVLLSIPQISSVDQQIYKAGPLALYCPPVWFVGIYEILLGARDPVFWKLAGHAFTALALATAVSILAYTMCYRRFMRKSIESGTLVTQSSAPIRTAVNLIWDRWLIRNSEQRASFHFLGQTVFRSPRHVLYVGTFLAVGLSITVMGVLTVAFSNERTTVGHLDQTILSIPQVLSFFLLVGMRVGFSIPVELESNWLFRLAPLQGIRTSYPGIRKWLIGAIVIPICLFSGIFYAFFWDWTTVLLHVCFGATMSWMLMELLFYRFPKIPFTCSYLPGASHIAILYPFYFIAFALFGYAAANLEVWLIQAPHRSLYFYVISAALFLLWMHPYRKSGADAIRFIEESENAPIYLDLRS